jgi:hypothetical protein
MIYAVSSARAAATRFQRITDSGKPIWRTDYFGPPPSPASSNSVHPDAPNPFEYTVPAPGETREPQAFLVEQAPGAIVHPHFHFVDQFQIVVDGDGRLGRHEVRSISAHFASACTGYGPITPGEQGLKYFSLRASADETGAQFLATNMHKMRKLPKRHAVTPAVVPSEPQALAARTQPQIDTVLREDDGLGVFMLRVPPNATLRAPDPAHTGGQSMIVAAGALLHAGASLDRWSCLYVSPDEPALELHAGPRGVEVLVAQFPRPGAA